MMFGGCLKLCECNFFLLGYYHHVQLSVKGKLHLTVVSRIAYKKIFTLVLPGPRHGQQTGLVKKNVNKGRKKNSADHIWE